MRKVCFLIPASPNEAFFSQIAAFRMAVSKLDWKRWQPSILVFFGGKIDLAALAAWRDALADIEMVFLSEGRFARESLFAQGDARFYMAPYDADVVVLSDADTLVVGSIEDTLDAVFEAGGVAGTIAHLPFPKQEGVSSRDAWVALSQNLIRRPLRFEHRYSLLKLRSPDVSEDELVCPFYLNFGVVFISRKALRSLADTYLLLRPQVASRISNRFFSAQIAFALAVAELEIPAESLSIAYNFPNDPDADLGYPDALSDVRIIHYLRKDNFDRWQIFASPRHYESLMSASLTGSNAVFRDYVRRAFGESYPFNLPATSASS